MEDIKIKAAEELYALICDTVKQRNFEHKQNITEKSIELVVNVDDRTIRPQICVDQKNELVSFLHDVNCGFGITKCLDGAVAASTVTAKLQYGSFDFNYSNNTVIFRLEIPYTSSQISSETINFMLDYTITAINSYEQDFIDLSHGKIDLDAFLAKF